ncbi:MAG: hypothetical protein ABI335_29805 [Polyangiaceae bacterium]
MSFCSSASGYACLSDWDRSLAVSHILNLLLDLKRALAAANGPVILILVVRESVPAPADYFLNCLQATLPAILDCCEQLLVVVEGSASDRAQIRAAFQTTRRTPTKHTPPQTFDSLSTAFAYAQPFASHRTTFSSFNDKRCARVSRRVEDSRSITNSVLLASSTHDQAHDRRREVSEPWRSQKDNSHVS